MKYLVALDIGTTNVRTIVYTDQGMRFYFIRNEKKDFLKISSFLEQVLMEHML